MLLQKYTSNLPYDMQDQAQGTCFMFIMYPSNYEGGYEELHQKFCELGVSGAHSVVHHDSSGEEKFKDHVHCIIEFPHNILLKTVVKFLEHLDVPRPRLVLDKPNRYRYLSHLDEDPIEKEHYDPKDVFYHGVPYWEYIETINGANEVEQQICEWIDKESVGIRSYRDLYNYCMYQKKIMWLNYVSKHVYFFSSYLKKPIKESNENEKS